MELREWLNRGYDCYKKLLIKQAHLESLGNAISNYEPREIDKDCPENSTETTFIRWSELKKEVDELSYKLLKIDRDTDAELKKLTDPNKYVVLYCRYVRRLSWNDVAKATNLSKQWTFTLHREGIEDLERINGYKVWEE